MRRTPRRAASFGESVACCAAGGAASPRTARHRRHERDRMTKPAATRVTEGGGDRGADAGGQRTGIVSAHGVSASGPSSHEWQGTGKARDQRNWPPAPSACKPCNAVQARGKRDQRAGPDDKLGRQDRSFHKEPGFRNSRSCAWRPPLPNSAPSLTFRRCGCARAGRPAPRCPGADDGCAACRPHAALLAAARRGGGFHCRLHLRQSDCSSSTADDLARYPRDDGSRSCHPAPMPAAISHGCPIAGHDVSGGLDATTIDGRRSLPLAGKGAARPGHFRGVATVVAKLFAPGAGPISRCSAKRTGSSLQVIRRMVADLGLAGPHARVIPTHARCWMGWRLSSRNRFLSPAEQRRNGTASCLRR